MSIIYVGGCMIMISVGKVGWLEHKRRQNLVGVTDLGFYSQNFIFF